MNHTSKRVSHYVLKEELGKNQFGQVFRGLDTETQEIRAIKMISNSKLLSEQQKEALKREIKIMKHLNHQNIVKLYDHIVSSKNNYLVLEYCSGGDLSKYSTGIGEAKTIIFLRQIISALKVLQDSKIVHRDLKPANILLSADGKVKLADFGLARQIDPESLAKTYVGTPLYMAPEVLSLKRGKHERYSDKADIWSVGCIVYELITGTRPFNAFSIDELIPTIEESLKNTMLFYARMFSPVCIDLLSRIFNIEPDQRINFNDFCDHPFILGMPCIKAAITINDIECLSEDNLDISRDEALDFAEVAIQIATNVSYPFLIHMKACMLLKPYLRDDNACAILFQANFEEANKYKNKTDWESTTITQLVLETVIQMCQNEKIEFNLLKENYRQAYILLKCLKPSLYVIKLKDAIKRQIDY